MDLSTLIPLIEANPKLSILVFSLIVTIFITIITYFFTDKEFMRTMKQKQKALREEMKKFRDNPQKMMELNKQMMEDFPKQMSQSLKVSVITLVPLLLLFGWLKNVYTPLLPHWIWWYILSSIIFSIFIRKIFKMD